MASTSMSITLPAALPGHFHSAFESTPVLHSTSGSPHRRKNRNPRDPKLPPLPAFSFNPGVGLGEDKVQEPERSPSPTHPIIEEMAARQDSRKSARPIPLPAFSFNPGAAVDPETSPTPSPTHPILEEMAQNRSRRSSRPAALTDIGLGSRGTEAQPSPSPTKSTSSDSNSATRSGGHRRRGSEYVGGGSDGSHLTSSNLISTSPNRIEQPKTHGPPVTGLGAGRHRHRRSEAVSISGIDASDLIKANAVAKHRAGSAPSTPSDPVPTPFFPSDSTPSVRQSISGISPERVTNSVRPRRESAPGTRPRVGFSDRVDVIPRPLSLISSETEGSNSTIRGTHSLTGSINSLAATSSPAYSTPNFILSKDDGSPRRRPNTADAASPSPASFATRDASPEEDGLMQRPMSASESMTFFPSSGSPTNRKKLFWFSPSNEPSPRTTPQAEIPDPISVLPEFAPANSSPVGRPKTSPERSASIKKRKVRAWTGHLFSRKTRPAVTKSKARRTPTPPLLTRRPTDRLNEVFDADDTIVLRTSPPPDHDKNTLQTLKVPCVAKSKTPFYSYGKDDSVTSPILDLDAALGPFGSEERLACDEGISKGASSRISRLHSSERRGPVDAFGAFHRRAESAPQMAPVNRNIFGIHGLGSSSSFSNDVFDEEEEDDFLANEKETDEEHVISSRAASLPRSTDDQIVQLRETQHSPPLGGESARETLTAPSGLGIAIAQGGSDNVAIVDMEDDVEVRPARSSNSTITPPSLPQADLPKRPSSSPMEFLYGAPQSTYASSTEGRTATNSAISSPDADHISFDKHPRQSRYVGEQTLDVLIRGSNDDLPSLTDSVSTGIMPRFSSSAGTRSSTEQRAASFSGATPSKPGHAWKRASLASLNRLIPGSANGSKLRFEETATATSPVEEEKPKKKPNRITRLVSFWRSKEKA